MLGIRRREICALFVAMPALLRCQSPFAGTLLEGRTMQKDSRVHALQTASFSYNFMNGHSTSWRVTLDLFEKHGMPLLQALQEKGYGVKMEIVPQRGKSEDDPEDYTVNIDFPSKAADSAGTAPSPLPPGVDPALIGQGKLAISAVAVMMTQLNVSNDSLQRRAFALLVLKEKIKAGEKADPFDPKRPAEESIKDIDLALQLVADHYEQMQKWRSRVLTMVALIAAFDDQGGLEALQKEVAAERAATLAWQASHRQPTLEDFGVAPAALPSTQDMLKNMDERLGMLPAVLETAKGIATGDPRATLEGLSKLAPKDSTVGIALNGLVAATKGDVGGVVDAVAKLSGKEEEVNAVKERLAFLDGIVKKAKELR